MESKRSRTPCVCACVRALKWTVAWSHVQTMNVNYPRGAVLLKNVIREEEVSQEAAPCWPPPQRPSWLPAFQYASLTSWPTPAELGIKAGPLSLIYLELCLGVSLVGGWMGGRRLTFHPARFNVHYQFNCTLSIVQYMQLHVLKNP